MRYWVLGVRESKMRNAGRNQVLRMLNLAFVIHVRNGKHRNTQNGQDQTNERKLGNRNSGVGRQIHQCEMQMNRSLTTDNPTTQRPAN